MLPAFPRARLETAPSFLVLLAALFLLTTLVRPSLAEDITFARPDVTTSISVSANEAKRFRIGAYEVLHLTGDVSIKQQNLRATSEEAILWVEIPDVMSSLDSNQHPYKVIAYLESDVLIERSSPSGEPPDQIRDEVWLGRLFTTATVDLDVFAGELRDQSPPAVFARAQQVLENGAEYSVRQVQFAQPQTLVSPTTGQVQQVVPNMPQVDSGFVDPGSIGVPVENQPASPPVRPAPVAGSVPQTTIDFSGRDSASDFNGTYQTSPTNPDERNFIGTGGVKVTISSPEFARMDAFRGDRDQEVVILADNVVAWQTSLPDGTARWEAYLEGNVIFAKDKRVIYAKRMYYDANFQRGTILDAEVLTPSQQFNGLVRMKADVIQQLDANNMQAYGAAVTSSRMGVPRYWLQSESIGLNRQQVTETDPRTGQPLFDSNGQVRTENEYWMEANRNRIYAGGLPVFGWPRLRTSLDDPTLYLSRLKIGNDRIFGTQIQTGWNMYQLLGVRTPPKGTKWIGLLDYLSERGLGFGSEFEYKRDNGLFGIPGRVNGVYKSWFINDDGLDQLGRGRFNLPPEEDFRGRTWARHRHQFYPGYQLKAELGYISDRNFLEQFYEREWDTYKDFNTGLWLERNEGTQSFNLQANVHVNDFHTETAWLPKFDQFIIGQPLAQDRFVWHGRNHIGYGRLRVADAPLNAAEAAKFDPLGWEANVDGLRAGMRHEIDMPIQVGPAKVVPYVLGDATFWQEALDGNDLFRAYGQAGIKASVPFWRVDPTIQSVLWNVNGLAHKVSFDFDAYYADASQDLSELALYEQLDDNAQEDFRRRFAFDTFGIIPGGNVPLKFDERYFALRSGLQGNVSSPSAEIADDLEVIKFGVRQRWQTKRGMPGRERIIDWVTLDTEVSFFPDANRDNFGSEFGLFDYDFRWHVGDRFTLVSDGFFDFFSDGLRTASLGVHAGRPEVGNVYLGIRSIEGPISSNILTAAATYRMSDKWGVKGTTQVDFGDTGTIGHALNLYYIGESFLWQLGLNADFARDNVGFRFGFEPRFLKQSRLFNPGGVPVGPAGARWLE